MVPYYVLFFSLIIGCFLELKYDELKIFNHSFETKKIINIYFLVLFLFIGIFRYEFLGVDVDNYSAYFHESNIRYTWTELLFNFSLDNGYYLLNKIFKILFNNFWIFKGFLYTATFLLYYKVIAERSKCISMSLIVFLGIERLLGIFCLLRQEVAIALCLYAIKYIEEKKLLNFLLIIFLAGTFHKTAYLFVAAYFFVNWKVSTKKELFIKYGLTLILTPIIGYFGLKFLISLYPIKYEISFNIGNGSFKLAYILFWIVASYLLLKKDNEETLNDIEPDNIYFKISYCSLFTQSLTMFLPIFTRITTYFLICFIFLIPDIYFIFKEKYEKHYKLFFIFIILFFSVLFFYTISGTLVPYKFQPLI